MKNLKYIFTLLLASAMFCACDDYLDVKPSKSTSVVIETGEHIEALLNYYTVYYEENSPWLANASDDNACATSWYDITGNKCEGFTTEALSYATWNKDFIPTFTDVTWTAEYQKIFYANTILEKADKVSGLTAEQREQIKREARFIRANSMWYLAQIYCLPYVAGNEDKQGIVLKSSTHFDESVKRASLKQTYEFIENDLKEALKIETPLKKVGTSAKYNTVRANKAAVNGFAARFYLYKNDYTNALKYAEEALKAHSELVNYNTEMSYMASCPTYTIAGETHTVEVPYTYEGSANKVNDHMLEWKELTYLRMASNYNWWYMPSDNLLALYDKEYDLRYKYHIVENFSYINSINTALPAYIFFWKDRIPSGTTTAEMLLIKAECQARLNSNPADAMATINTLRAARMDNNAPADVINLSASSQEDAVKKILQERRRELPFVRRFMDIRRLNSNDCSYDDPGDITKTFYDFTLVNININATKTYTLQKNSSLYACPLPETEFIASDFVIDQNIY